ncbi:hypothetical protein FKP32DRAFT_665892 [Trametes sanguinea]|nr:hypothetical protein FKP32DRAFT_665892 [Trametes sanguinea]
MIRAEGAMCSHFLVLQVCCKRSVCWSMQMLVRARLQAAPRTQACGRLQRFRGRESTAPVSSAGEKLPLGLRHAEVFWGGLWLIASSEDWPCMLSLACRSRLWSSGVLYCFTTSSSMACHHSAFGRAAERAPAVT